MQPIRDKNFDQLFKTAFNNAEIAPSKDLWSNIESKIEPGGKKITSVYWLSAAVILLVAATGILIYQQQNVSSTQFTNYVAQKVKQPVKDLVVINIKPFKKVESVLPVGVKAAAGLAKTIVKKVVKPAEKQKIVVALEVLKSETALAKTDEPNKDIKTKIEDAILQPKQETVIAATSTLVKTDDVENENNQAENKGIRNVGDVVNLIVNQVDKRKDKFIQFRTDDDDSSLSSINIGPFKIGKKKK